MARTTKQTTARDIPAAAPPAVGAASEGAPRAAVSARQAEVLAFAAELFARDGYAATTVRDIADAAGILSGSLYHHFASKEAMVDAILAAFFDDALGRYDEIVAAQLPPRETFEALATASLLAIERHQAAVVIYETDGRHLGALERFGYLREAGERFERAWVGTLQRGIDEREFRGSLDPQLTYRLIRSALWTVARWYRADGELPAQAIAERYLSVLLEGIARGKRKKSKG